MLVTVASAEIAAPRLAAPHPAAIPLVGVLGQLAEVLSHLPPDDYARKPVGVVASSVGGHVRHCLDHVGALLAALECGGLDYDHRERGTDVETDRGAALALLRRQVEQLLCSAIDLTRPVRLTAL